jgi:hypothetical protein
MIVRLRIWVIDFIKEQKANNNVVLQLFAEHRYSFCFNFNAAAGFLVHE